MTEIATRTPEQELVSQVRSPEFREQISAALPGNLLPERFQRAATTALMANPDLARLERNSLFVALLQAAQAGLLPDGKEAAIVAYKDRAQFLAMKDGYIKRAGESGWQVSARVVYEADEFAYEEGLDPKLRHVPVRPGVERGKRIAAYAIARHRDGRVAPPVVMYEDEIAKRRAKAQTQAVWNEWTDRMFEKTVIKALVKELPTSDLSEWAQRVIAAEESDPRDAVARMYGPNGATATPQETAADGGAPAVQQAEAAVLDDPPAAASAPDLDGEPTLEEDSPYQPPAGAVSEDTLAAQAAADAAGRYVVDRGAPKGKTIEEIANGPRGEGWLLWVISGREGEPPPKDHPATSYAKAYVRFYNPELFQRAMAKIEAQTQ